MRDFPIRWFGAGHSTASGSAAAGTEATAAAVAERDASLLMVFASLSYDLPALLAAVRAAAGDGPIIVGGTTLGEISAAGPTSGGLVVVALGGPGFTIRARVVQVAPGEQRQAGAAVAEAMTGIDQPYTALVLMGDGLVGDPHELVRGAYSVVGAAVPLVGGFIGDDQGMRAPAQFFGEGGDAAVLSLSAIGVAIGSDAPIGIGVAYGWHRIEPAMIVSKSSGGRIFEIDGVPALDALLARYGLSGGTKELFADDVPRPIGLSRRGGEDIRIMHEGDDADRSIGGLAGVPQGALFWLMEADHEALVQGASQSCAEAVDGLRGAPAIGLIAFDCGVRKGKLGPDGIRQEVATMSATLGDVPFAGFYTVGEIARARSASGMHHMALVTLALA
jgi:hypothetical protein